MTKRSFESVHKHCDPVRSRHLTLQIGCPTHRGKTIGRQKAGDVLYEDTGDIALKGTGPSVEFREFEFITARSGHYLRPVKIVGYENGTYGNN
jgi:hypothetical protein